MSTEKVRRVATCHPGRRDIARGLCMSCYRKIRAEERPVEEARKARGVRICSRCGAEKPITEFDRPSAHCKDCRREISREYARAKRAAGDPIYLEKRRRAAREWHRRNKAYARDRHLRHKYGITAERYDELFEQQGGVCAICRGKQLGGRLLAVDHNHDTGEVRGLLCDPCNQGIGFFADDPARLQAAIEYLNR